GVARGDRLHLGIRQLLAADVVGTPHGALAPHDLRDELRFCFEGLPDVTVEGTNGYVTGDGDNFVLVALSQDSAVALLDLGGLPGSVKVMERHEPLLD